MEQAKIGLVLQCCPDDMYIAEDLAELICDIEPEVRNDIEFILLRRRDVNGHFALKVGKMVKTKFPRYTDVKCRRFGTGWPIGCNDLWQDGMRQISALRRMNRLSCDAVLTFEPDCVPMRRDWINLLIAEWTKAKEAGKLVCGYLADGNHINGNAIFDSRITTAHPKLLGSPGETGWDYDHREYLVPNAYVTDAILQIYRIKFIRLEKFAAIRSNGKVPALFHGVKDGLGIKLVRQMIESGIFP